MRPLGRICACSVHWTICAGNTSVSERRKGSLIFAEGLKHEKLHWRRGWAGSEEAPIQKGPEFDALQKRQLRRVQVENLPDGMAPLKLLR